jgi:hypothetical protein
MALNTSNLFGVAAGADVNQAGDYAFLGNGASALFLRPAGTGIVQRVFQMGDPIPGVPGSRADILQSLRLNNSGKLAFVAQFNTTAGFSQAAILVYDGVTLQRIVSSADIAPGTGGAIFGRNLAFGGINDNGDIAFTGTLLPLGSSALTPTQSTLFFVPNGGAPARIVGPGDPGRDSGSGTFTKILLGSGTTSLNNSGEVLFGDDSQNVGLFVGSTTAIRVIAISGLFFPGRGIIVVPGTTPSFPVPSARLNNAGQVAFAFASGLYVHTPGVGIAKVINPNDAAPVALGGTFSGSFGYNLSALALNDSGAVAFTANITGSGTTPRGLFRFVPAAQIQTVAFANQVATGAGPATFSTFSAVSMNSTGLISFFANLVGGTINTGVFQQSAANAPNNLALQGQSSPIAGGTFNLTGGTVTKTLNSGSTYFLSDLIGAAADYAEFVGTPGSLTLLMSNADTLPSGSRTSLRTFQVGAAGDYAAFVAQQTGGRFSIMVRNRNTGVTTAVGTAGDVAPGTGGGLLRAQNGLLSVNTSGTVVFNSQIIGGTQVNSIGVFVWTPAGGMTKLVATGDLDPNSGSPFVSPSANSLLPSTLNESGQVVFRATVLGKSGLYVGSVGGPIQRIAQNGDAAPGGGTFVSFSSTDSINQSGNVAFFATTTGGPGQNQGIFVGTPGGVVSRIAVSGDAAPGGNTFFSFPGSVSFNDSGEVAFIASLGPAGATGGVFVGTNPVSLQALARDGDASPASGNFAFTRAAVDILINNQHDLVFRSALTGGASDSGYFLRRGASGPLRTVAAQGQAAPGNIGPFNTIDASLNIIQGESFALGPTGEVAFQAPFQTGGGLNLGTFRYRTDNLLDKILARGDVVPGTGNGVMVVNSQILGAGGPGHFAFWAGIFGGNVDDLIYFTDSPAGFGISGQVKDVNGVGIAGVQVTLSGAVNGLTTTDNAGNFSFLNLTNGGNYILTPSSANFSFSPGNQTFNNLGVDRIANFVGTKTTINITGNVVDGSNNPLNNVTVALTKNGAAAGTVQTNASGDYSFNNQTVGANYVVTPVGTFTPSSQTLNNLTTNAVANFKAGPSIPPQCNTPSFAGATNFAAGSGAYFVAVADFNADGRLDLAIANSGSTSVSILLGSGTGSFSATTNFTAGTGPRFVAVRDFNGDGKLDLAVANGGASDVSILLGAGDGSFGAATNFAVGPNPESLAVGDFNGDSKLDLAVANAGSNNVSILLGTGTGSFGAATNFAVGSGPISVVVGDFDSDGKLDLAVANSPPGVVSILLGTGTGSFGAATNFAVGTGPRFAAVADFNGDGQLDLAVANQSIPTISILLGTGTGSFSVASNFAAGSGPEAVAVADFNGDGKLDVAINNPGGSVSVLLGNGAGSLGSTINFAVGAAPRSVAIGDFNGDGKSDLAVVNFASNNVSVLLNNGTLCNTQSSLTISGQITTANNAALADVTVTLSGPITRVTTTDASGNYSFPNLVPGGNYAVTVQSNYFVVAPSRSDFFNLSGSQTVNFIAAPLAVPSPTPTPSDNFNNASRDASKWTIGAQTESPVAFDPQVTTAQLNGQLVITPVTQASGLHYGGYASTNSFDLRNGQIGVEVVKAATGGADTIFAIGSDSDNFYRFMVHTSGTPTSLAPLAKGRDGVERPLDATTAQLVFQVNVGGQLTSLSINYDPVQHRFMRFRHVPAANSIVFETSPDSIDYTVQHTVVLQKGVSALTAELSAGTSNPANPGQTVFDNFGLLTSTFQFSAGAYFVGEGDGSVLITVTRTGSTTDAASVRYATSDGTATQSNKYITTVGTLSFAPGQTSRTFSVLIVDNVLTEGNQALNLMLTSPTASGLNSPGRAVLTIIDNDSTVAAGNPLDDPPFYVRQQYYDFLNREPDSSGLAFWTNQITECQQPGATCSAEVRRINVSAAFFLSIEFQETGYLVERIYRAAYGNGSGTSTLGGTHQLAVPVIRFQEFVPDTQQISQGVVVGATGWEQVLENNKQAFLTDYVQRTRFTTAYPTTMSAAQYVDTLNANAGGALSTAERNQLVSDLTSGAKTRAQALRAVAEDADLFAAERNRAFVLAQYFGYLRRNPNDTPDSDYTGYDFWLGKLNQFSGNFVNAEMVKAFIQSDEYRHRFGP